MQYLNRLGIQALRFGAVGLASNLMLYVLFLFLTYLGFDTKWVVTIIYALGLSITFVFNKRWSFSHRGDLTSSMGRYLFLYGCLYLANMFVVLLLVDVLHFSPAIVQACVVLIFIPIVFLVQRYWVFRPNLFSTEP